MCVCLSIVVSNVYDVVLCFCFVLRLVVSFSGLFLFDCPFDILQRLFKNDCYLLLFSGSLQMSTVVAGVCACLAVVATGFAIIGWKRKSTKYNLVS